MKAQDPGKSTNLRVFSIAPIHLQPINRISLTGARDHTLQRRSTRRTYLDSPNESVINCPPSLRNLAASTRDSA